MLLVCVVLAGCYQPDKRAVGHFEASSGESLDILPSGQIMFTAAEGKERVGLVTIVRDHPLTIRVIAPDTSPLIGTTIVFSADRREIFVEWRDYRQAGDGQSRPTRFQKE